MASSKHSKTLQSLEAIGRDLSHLRGDVEDLVKGVRTDSAPILSEVHARLASKLDEAQAVVAPLVALLGSNGRAPGPSAPAAHAGRKGAAKPKGRPKKKRGVRGVKANLSATEIDEALASAGGVKTKAAAALGVSVPTFNKYLAATKSSGKTSTAKKGGARKRGKRKPRAGRAKKKKAAA